MDCNSRLFCVLLGYAIAWYVVLSLGNIKIILLYELLSKNIILEDKDKLCSFKIKKQKKDCFWPC